MAWLGKGRLWPTMIAAVLVGDLVFGVAMMRLAADDRHFAVEPDYYRKAVAWDATMAQAAANRALGWTVTPELGRLRRGLPDTLALHVAGADGMPIAGAQVSVEAMPVAYAGEAVRSPLPAAREPGRYAAGMTVSRAGLWEVRVRVERGSERFTADLRLDVSATGDAKLVTARPGDATR